nr:MAG: hypothetical protein [Microvirus sp.]
METYVFFLGGSYEIRKYASEDFALSIFKERKGSCKDFICRKVGDIVFVDITPKEE